jgi:hypothetical protein
VDKEAADPSLWREEGVARAPAGASSRTVRVGCDDDGLHIRAPQGSRVTVPDDATYPAEAEIAVEEDVPARPLRRTKSLGFIGDNKLTPTPSRGGPWNVPDGLLPPHEHVEPRYDVVPFFAPYAYRGRVAVVLPAPTHPAVPPAPAASAPGAGERRSVAPASPTGLPALPW